MKTLRELTDIGARKLTNEELVEIGAKAGLATGEHSTYYAAFAAAVAAEVRNECEAKFNACEAARLRACDDHDAARQELTELIERHQEMCSILQDCVQTYNLGLGGEKIDKLVVEEVGRLRAEREELLILCGGESSVQGAKIWMETEFEHLRAENAKQRQNLQRALKLIQEVLA